VGKLVQQNIENFMSLIFTPLPSIFRKSGKQELELYNTIKPKSKLVKGKSSDKGFQSPELHYLYLREYKELTELGQAQYLKILQANNKCA